MPDVEQPSDFELFIGGQKFVAFTSGWVSRRLDTAADTFELRYADLREDLSEDPPIKEGDPCEIRLRGQLILTGYVDDISIQYAADRLSLTARGRSKTADLVDSSAVIKSGRFTNKRLDQIATALCEPFGIKVTVNPTEDTPTPFRRFAVEPGETVMDAIVRACRLRGVWPTNTVEGGLLLTRAASGNTAPLPVKYGDNVIEGELFRSWAQRFDRYVIRGQVPSDDELSGPAASQMADLIQDDAINRYRPLLLVSTGHDRKGDLRRRAQWERNRRLGTGERLIYRVGGYGYPTTEYVGPFSTKKRDALELWEPNMEVKAVDPRLGVDAWFLLSAVTFRWDAEGNDAGRATDLTLVPKEAFSLEDPPPRRRRNIRGNVPAKFPSAIDVLRDPK